MSTVKYLLCGGQGTVQASEGVGEILNISMQYPQPRSSPSLAVPPPLPPSTLSFSDKAQ